MAGVFKSFLSGLGASGKAPRSPAKREKPSSESLKADLARCWTYVHRTFFLEAQRPHLAVGETELPARLDEIAAILQADNDPSDTTRNPTPCMEYFLNSGIMQHLYDHAVDNYPKGMLLAGTRALSPAPPPLWSLWS
jgi:hypothetical protein